MTQERLKLTVTEVGEPRPISPGGAQKLSFKARTADGRELIYFTFATRLFPHIRLGQLEADVETTTKDTAGGTFTDRKVTQVYEDGPAAGGAANNPGPARPAGAVPTTGVITTEGHVPPAAVTRPAGWQPRADNSASIEAQTAAKIGGVLLAAGTITQADPLGQATLRWCLAKLGGGVELKAVRSSPDS